MLLFLCKLLSRIPLVIMQAFGWLAGWLAWLASPRHRRVMRETLQQSGIAADPVSMQKLLRASIGEQGISALELLPHWLRPLPNLLRHVKREGWEHVENALSSGNPVIFLSPHLGALEMTGVCIAGWVDRTLAPLYRPPKQAFLEPLMIASRSRSGAKPAPANASGVRVLLKTLKQGGVAYLLPDQAPSGGEGIWAPFFGRPAYTMTLVSKMAVAADAVVLCCYTRRLGIGRGYCFHIEPMQGAFNGDALHDATTLNRNMENMIRQAPAQYLWSYNRYKQPYGAPAAGESA